jgi:O-acetylserine/cysteine efflux transporter
MNTGRRTAVAALTAAGLLWGTTVPLSKVALEWLPPGWLALVRFTVAAAVLLGVARFRVRAACRPAVLATGALGYGGTVLVQNLAITRTSVSHAALLIGAAPVMVAIIAAVWHRSVARPAAWAGFAVSLGGVALVAGGGGGGATVSGDGLVLLSVLLSAGFTVSQGRLLRGQDPIAMTAVQFAAAALVALPVALLSGRIPAAPGSGPMLAVAVLALGGTVLPFTLFAFGQRALPAEVAGAFLNLEPLVGAVAGVVAFGDPAGGGQLMGGAAIVGGIGLSTVRLSTLRLPRLRRRRSVIPAPAALSLESAALDSAALDSAALDIAALDIAALECVGLDSTAPGNAALERAAWDTAGPVGPRPGRPAPAGAPAARRPFRSGQAARRAGRRIAPGHQARGARRGLRGRSGPGSPGRPRPDSPRPGRPRPSRQVDRRRSTLPERGLG